MKILKNEYIWYGFPAFCMFCFGKYAGFLTCSWWWILVTFLIVIKRKTVK